MRTGELWFVANPGGDRPVLVLTRDPVADRIGAVAVAALTRTRRGLVSELGLTVDQDHVPSDCIVNFDNTHTLPRNTFRPRITRLSPTRLHEGCRPLRAAPDAESRATVGYRPVATGRWPRGRISP
jgi:mRNA interferase MazF